MTKMHLDVFHLSYPGLTFYCADLANYLYFVVPKAAACCLGHVTKLRLK